MKSIYKYELNPNFGLIELPRGAQILSVQCQQKRDSWSDKVEHVPYVWALVDPKIKKIERKIRWIGTGWDLQDNELTDFDFVSTVQVPDTLLGTLVFHFFIEKV